MGFCKHLLFELVNGCTIFHDRYEHIYYSEILWLRRYAAAIIKSIFIFIPQRCDVGTKKNQKKKKKFYFKKQLQAWCVVRRFHVTVLFLLFFFCAKSENSLNKIEDTRCVECWRGANFSKMFAVDQIMNLISSLSRFTAYFVVVVFFFFFATHARIVRCAKYCSLSILGESRRMVIAT